jgi:hypothetical protein
MTKRIGKLNLVAAVLVLVGCGALDESSERSAAALKKEPQKLAEGDAEALKKAECLVICKNTCEAKCDGDGMVFCNAKCDSECMATCGSPCGEAAMPCGCQAAGESKGTFAYEYKYENVLGSAQQDSESASQGESKVGSAQKKAGGTATKASGEADGSSQSGSVNQTQTATASEHTYMLQNVCCCALPE